MMSMAISTESRRALQSAIEHAGYYPSLVQETLEAAIGDSPIQDFVVQHETTFDRADQIRRHITVLLLTSDRLIVLHVDEHSETVGGPLQAAAVTESVPLTAIGPVVLHRTINDPARHKVGDLPTEVLLTLSWGNVSRMDLEPATCGDPACEADHGYTGAITRDDWTLRASVAADGADVVRRTLGFATSLIKATGSNR